MQPMSAQFKPLVLSLPSPIETFHLRVTVASDAQEYTVAKCGPEAVTRGQWQPNVATTVARIDVDGNLVLENSVDSADVSVEVALV